jgi:hypothetical protein
MPYTVAPFTAATCPRQYAFSAARGPLQLNCPQVRVARHRVDDRCISALLQQMLLAPLSSFLSASTAAQQLNVLFSPVGGAALSELALLSSGPLMVDIENILLPKATGAVVNSSDDPALFHVMLGHDITIFPLVASLRLRGCDGISLSQDWPPFAR